MCAGGFGTGRSLKERDVSSFMTEAKSFNSPPSPKRFVGNGGLVLAFYKG